MISGLLTALLVGLAAPGWSQDVFGGNGNQQGGTQQKSGDSGVGVDNALFLRRNPPQSGVKYCPQDHGYYYDARLCGHLENQGRQPPQAINPNPCQPGGRGSYDWRNNPKGTQVPPDCATYMARRNRLERRGQAGRRYTQGDGLDDRQRAAVLSQYRRIQEKSGMDMANDWAMRNGYRPLIFGPMRPNSGLQASRGGPFRPTVQSTSQRRALVQPVRRATHAYRNAKPRIYVRPTKKQSR